MERKETVGKISSDLLQKSSDNTHSAEDQMREQLTDWHKNIEECIQRCSKEFPRDFYVVVTTKKERLMPNVIRNYFFGRQSCPTPEYDQTVFRYIYDSNELEFLWTVPAQDICCLMRDNALEVHESERALLNFVLEFFDGSLLRLAKKLNKEEDSSTLLIKERYV